MIRRLYKYLTEEKHGQRMMQGRDPIPKPDLVPKLRQGRWAW